MEAEKLRLLKADPLSPLDRTWSTSLPGRLATEPRMGFLAPTWETANGTGTTLRWKATQLGLQETVWAHSFILGAGIFARNVVKIGRRS